MDCAEGLTIRALGPGDEDALAALFAKNDVPEVTRWFGPFPLTAGTARAISRYRGGDLYLGGWSGSELVALAMARGPGAGYRHPAYGCLVDRPRQGRGIGTALTVFALEQLRRRGVREVRARVHDDNRRSLRMHRAAGFEEVRRDAHRVLMAARPVPVPE